MVILRGVEVQAYAHEGIHSNECVLCQGTPAVGFVSIFLKGLLGTHLGVHLCEKHWNDVNILQGISQASQERADEIKQGVTWGQVTMAS